MNFKYIENPYNSSAISYSEKPQKCDICQKHSTGYEGACYGYDNINFVCEDCLSNGKLKEKGSEANIGHRFFLKRQLKKIYPDKDERDIETLVNQRTDEINYRTPHLTTFQEFSWPVHCGDYCRFIMEAGQSELNSLSSGNGKDFLKLLPEWENYGNAQISDNQKEYKEIDDVDWLWNYLPLHSPKNKSDPTSPLFLFQCLVCKKYIALLDFD
jgi:uncharacterized protein CbrC (UPF0167 family)